MSSPASDNNAGMKAPCKSVAESATKDIASLHTQAKVNHGSTKGELVKTNSIGSKTGSCNDAQHENVEIPGTNSVDASNVVGSGAQDDYSMNHLETADIGNTDVFDSIGSGAQIDAAEITDTDNDSSQHVDTKCVAVPTCVASSGDHRKVVSHIFGRNKTCTRELPSDLWIFWCRKHYQRFKYRSEDAENWHTRQLGLVRDQLQTFEDWGEIRSWNIILRKAEQDALEKEDADAITNTNHVSTPKCWERFLVPYLGSNKTFAQVRTVLYVIENKFNEPEYMNRRKKQKTFPGVEFLPIVYRCKGPKKPATKKSGEVTYKKITLDQAQFKSKTRANSHFLKEVAAKKRHVSNTPEHNSRPFKNKSSSDFLHRSNAAPSKKRKASPPDRATTAIAGNKRNPAGRTAATPSSKASPAKRNASSPTQVGPSSGHGQTLPPKRRRLTRGYEKNGSDREKGLVR